MFELLIGLFFFFFKQKTADEMRISDWSSDVCSSDLDPIEELLGAALDFETLSAPSLQLFLDWFDRGDVEIVRDPSAPLDAVRVMTVHGAKIGRASCRERVCQYV